MKMKFWLILATTVSTGLLAQQAPNASLALPPVDSLAAATNAPAKTVRKKSHKANVKHTPKAKKSELKNPETPAADLKTTALVPGPATVSAQHVNVRGKAGLKGEVIAHLTKGDPLTVVEEIRLKHSAADEPSVWAKVLLPATTHVWVSSQFIDTASKAVSAKKVNLRGGPGENYSVLGVILKGQTISEITNKNGWIQIQSPSNAFAYVAAQYLTQEAQAIAAVAPAPAAPVEPSPAPVPVPAPVVVPPPAPVVPTAVIEPPAPVVAKETPAPAPVEVPAAPSNLVASIPATNTLPFASPNHLEPAAPAAPAVEEPLPPRIIDHEGWVRSTASIQAPTKFELISPDNHEVINYLYTTSTNLDLSRYKGMHIVVTGQEGLDERWKHTPVITIQKIEVIE